MYLAAWIQAAGKIEAVQTIAAVAVQTAQAACQRAWMDYARANMPAESVVKKEKGKEKVPGLQVAA